MGCRVITAGPSWLECSSQVHLSGIFFRPRFFFGAGSTLMLEADPSELDSSELFSQYFLLGILTIN
jgi:hypothetical protein